MWKLMLAGVCLIVTNRYGDAACGICQTNGVACINDTSFYPCYGGSEPNTEQLFTCTSGLVCTDTPLICFQSSSEPPSCVTSTCDVCNSQQTFACTSRTTFAFCFGALIPTDMTGTCPDGMICDALSPNICVSQPNPTSIVCARDKP